MTSNADIGYLKSLVHELIKLPAETEWVEFKANNNNPDDIGEYISALSNSAAMHGKITAYMLWGVDDATHTIAGTTFRPSVQKIGNEELESWLLRLLSPKINFRFFESDHDGKTVVILEVQAAFRHPVQFKNVEYIRVGSYKKKLKDFPEKERTLWRVFDKTSFEDGIAKERVTSDEVLKLIDYPAYFDMMNRPLPDNRSGIMEAIIADELIRQSEAGDWNITNLGAILFAKRLEDFRTLRRKAVRVILYRGASRIETIKEQVGTKGYACGFEELISLINSLLPSNEVIEQALRKTLPMYPEVAVRELVANALIHQDFYQTGTGTMIEIFSNRMEITNPGLPLVKTDRFLDSPPKSRNERLASFMRRIGICEERGSGIDKVVSETEFYQLPAPAFEVTDEHTRAVLFSHREFREMDKKDRIRACYLHACLRYVQRDYMTNKTLRTRFGIEEKNSSIVSRIIKETLDAGMIIAFEESLGRKYMKYLPVWAR